MCVSFRTYTQIAKRALFFFKRVHRLKPGVFTSGVPAAGRGAQGSSGKCGTDFTYRIGERATSKMPRTPGLYCFTKLSEAHNYEHVIIRVRVPKGTKIRYAYGHKVCVESLIPVRSVRNPDAA